MWRHYGWIFETTIASRCSLVLRSWHSLRLTNRFHGGAWQSVPSRNALGGCVAAFQTALWLQRTIGGPAPTLWGKNVARPKRALASRWMQKSFWPAMTFALQRKELGRQPWNLPAFAADGQPQSCSLSGTSQMQVPCAKARYRQKNQLTQAQDFGFWSLVKCSWFQEPISLFISHGIILQTLMPLCPLLVRGCNHQLGTTDRLESFCLTFGKVYTTKHGKMFRWLKTLENISEGLQWNEVGFRNPSLCLSLMGYSFRPWWQDHMSLMCMGPWPGV